MIGYEQGERFLTVSEVSRLLHIHPNTLRRWADEGRIESYRITNRGDRRFKESDVTNFITELNPHLDHGQRLEQAPG